MIHLYDANNVLQRTMNTIGTGHISLRSWYLRMQSGRQGEHIWVWDGHKHNDRRRQVYPEYKANRTPPAENVFAHIQLFKQLVLLTPASRIIVDGWEADDVIATLAMNLCPEVQVTVHTNDMDYAQLEHPNIRLNGVNTKGVPARMVPLYKAVVGDPSDNIAGIPGFGAKTWATFLFHAPLVFEAFMQGKFDVLLDPSLGLSKRITAWLETDDNLALVGRMFRITQFMAVPNEEISNGIRFGSPDPTQAEAMLKELFL